MKRDDYIFISARINVYEKGLLKEEILERMIRSDSFEDSIKILGETRYSDLLNKKDMDFYQVLSEELKIQAQKLFDLVEDEDLKKLLFSKYDYHNLKLMVKERLDEKDYKDLYYDFFDLDYEKIDEGLGAGIEERSIRKRAIDEAIKSYERKKDPMELDLIFDKAYFEEMKEITDGLGFEYFMDYLEKSSDFNNVTTFLRIRERGWDKSYFIKAFLAGGKLDLDFFKKSFSLDPESFTKRIKELDGDSPLYKAMEEYLESGDLSLFSKRRDQFLYSLQKRADGVLYGPEKPFSYFKRIEGEIQNLRIILMGKKAHMDRGLIRERVRLYA